MKIVIIDWDDTLFPSTWINMNNIDIKNKIPIGSVYYNRFRILDNLVFELLSKILKQDCQLYIVSNGSYKWIDDSSKLLPDSKRLINMKVTVLSARDMYIKKFSSIDINYANPEKWKRYVFKLIYKSYKKYNNNLSIISIGDAEYEYNALIELYDKSNVLLKAIKLLEAASYNIIVDQLELLIVTINYIILHNDNLDLCFKNI